MSLFDGVTASAARKAEQEGFAFPQALSDKYQPATIDEFVGLEKPKRIFSKFLAAPYKSAWLFCGPPGTGKTTFAIALAKQLNAEVKHVPSQECNVANVNEVIRQCWYVPKNNTFHVVLVDEGRQDVECCAACATFETRQHCISSPNHLHLYLQFDRRVRAEIP